MDSTDLIRITKEHHMNFSKILRSLHINDGDCRCRRYLKAFVETNMSGELKHKVKKGKCNYSINDVREAAKSSLCFSDILKQIGLSIHGTNTNTIKKIIKENNIDISHFNQGQACRRNKKCYSYAEIFCENSLAPRGHFRQYVVKYNILEQVCNECKISTTYNNKPISLTIDHINGISSDNRIENLRWLCPNCHSQTNTYCGRNRKDKRYSNR